MDTFSAIKQRRAIKKFDPNHQMTDAEIDTLFSSAVLSPTSYNIQNWRFVIVKEKSALRHDISKAAWGQEQVVNASLLIIICADLKAWDKTPERYWSNTPKAVQDQIVPMIRNFYNSKEQVQRDEAMRSAGIAAQTIMLAAKDMGYDSCPMIGFDSEHVSELINLPDDHVICMMISVGKAIEPAKPRGGQLPLADVVIENGF